MKRVRVPFVLQMENVECGAACLAMILKYFGREDMSLEQLRVDCSVSKDGVNAKGIKRAAVKNGLVCKAFRADPQSVKNVPLPAIIHWNMGHFVVLCGFDKNGYYINDPALGRYKASCSEFDGNFTGIVLTFGKSDKFVSAKKHADNSFTLNCIKRYIPGFVFISFVLMTVTVFGMLMPFFNSAYIDNILLDNRTDSFFVLAASMVSVMLLSFIASVLYERMGYEIQRNLNISLSIGFMEKILRLPITFFSQRAPGELANRQLGSFETAQLAVKYISPILFQGVLMVLYCTAAFVFDVSVAFVGIAAIILNITAVIYISGKLGTISALCKKNEAMLQGSAASAVDMIETIKSCSCEDAMFARLTGMAALNIGSSARTDKLNIYLSSAFYFINSAVSAAILTIGAYKVLSGSFSVGTAVGVMGMLSAFLTPLGSFMDSVSAIFGFKSIIDRTDDTMKYADENIFLPFGETQTKRINGEVRAEDVSFCYPGSSDYAISGVSFTLEKGKSIAFTGGSGSGKSTAAKLAAGLYTETQGHIYYGTAEKSELKREYFYSKIAVVSQGAQLYEGTVFDNITMWDKTITYEDVVTACKKACIHDDIVVRKGAYYEMITEGGKNLSGGQRQRIEIARAIARRPEILILDEATSALDAKTEKEVMENILSLGITLIIIAHRLSTIRSCDEILVFKDGKIAERGNHASLVKNGGIYYRLVSDNGE